MKVSFISSQAVSQALRHQLLRMQAELVKSETEIATGRVADRGLALGARTGQTISFGRDVERLEGLLSSNGLASGRLSATQDALGRMHQATESFLSTLTTVAAGATDSNIARAEADSVIGALTAMINGSFNGEHLFAGINTDVRPINDFADPASPNKAAFDAAFLGHFGFAQNDPLAAGITPGDMQVFLDTVVEPQFLGAGWQASWSNATDDLIVSRIALNETAETSVSANHPAIRKLAMAAATVSDLLSGNLNQGAQQAVLDRAVALAGEALAGIADLQAETGIKEKRITTANERITMQIDLFNTNIQDMEGIDPYEVSTRISQLLTQIETSYALTARIQQLSLARFLP